MGLGSGKPGVKLGERRWGELGALKTAFGILIGLVGVFVSGRRNWRSSVRHCLGGEQQASYK